MNFLILAQGASFSPIELFLQADLVVKAVIIGLALASIWAWTIIFSFMLKIVVVGCQFDKKTTEKNVIFKELMAALTAIINM